MIKEIWGPALIVLATLIGNACLATTMWVLVDFINRVEIK